MVEDMVEMGKDIIEEDPDIKGIWSVLEGIPDPEIPVISVVDLGIIRKVERENGRLVISTTPTYSGCPAIDVIKTNIRIALLEAGYRNADIKTVLFPPWTTEWMSVEGKRKLKEYGIAPPHSTQIVCTPENFQAEEAIQCPRCNSFNTMMVSRFGSTPCKALYKCKDCDEPFDYFKCH